MISSQAWSKPVIIESGVSLALAKERAARISNIHYQLDLDVPADMHAPIRGRLVLTFELNDSNGPLQLDFQQPKDHLVSVTSEKGDIDYRFEQEHLVIPPSALNKGHNPRKVECTQIQEELWRCHLTRRLL